MTQPKYKIGDTVWTYALVIASDGEVASAETVELLIVRVMPSVVERLGMRYKVRRVGGSGLAWVFSDSNRLRDTEPEALAMLRARLELRIEKLNAVLSKIVEKSS